MLIERVNEAQRLASRELREMQAQDPKRKGKVKKRKGDTHDDSEGDERDASEGSTKSINLSKSSTDRRGIEKKQKKLRRNNS